MDWNLEETVTYYKKQGAPADQSMLINLLLEVQSANGGAIPASLLESIARLCGTKETLLRAVIRRVPRLRLADTHLLEICAGPNCGKHTALLAMAEKAAADHPGKLTVKKVPCQRLCGKGPNLKWNGTLYHRADKALLSRLLSELNDA